MRMALASLALAFLVANPVLAAPRRASPSVEAQALDRFEKSVVAYREGRFQQAIQLLLEARELKPEPVLLYNLGRAYEASGKLEEAVDAYGKYLEEDPGAIDRKGIEAKLATLRAQIEEREALRKPPPPARVATPAPAPEPPPAPPPADPLRPLPWIVMGVGALAVGTGVVLRVVAQSKHDDAAQEESQTVAQDRQDDAVRWARASTIAFIAGGLVALTGLVWLLLEKPVRHANTRIGPLLFRGAL
jgi:tetratricopeptide (TPR) repeat protein